MDAQVRKRINKAGVDILWESCTGRVDGDAQYAAPQTIKGLVVERKDVIHTTAGMIVVNNTVVILDGIYADSIKTDDALTLPRGNRKDIKKLNPIRSYLGLTELLEVSI
jgi:hypothetical protein